MRGTRELYYAEAIREDVPVSGDKAGPAVAIEDLMIHKSNQKRGRVTVALLVLATLPRWGLHGTRRCLFKGRSGIFKAHARLQQINGP